MAAAPRDMTTGEIEVRLDSFEKNVMAALSEIKDNMVTVAVFDARDAAREQRVQRLELDHQRWVKESTEAHVTLDSESKARHAETGAAMKALETKFETRFEKAEDRAFHLEQAAKAQKNSKWQAIGVAVLGSVLSIFASIFISITNRVLGG
jgi:acetyl-CoA carboxylase alpha subunit